MLAIIRILAILIAIFFVLLLKDEASSMAFFVVGTGVFLVYNLIFVIYHPIVGLIAIISLISIVVLFILDTKKEIEKYKLRRMLYPLMAVYSISFLIECAETIMGRLF